LLGEVVGESVGVCDGSPVGLEVGEVDGANVGSAQDPPRQIQQASFEDKSKFMNSASLLQNR